MNALVLPLLFALSGPAPAADPEARRYALVVGANDGGSGRTRLRYATDDARRMAQVLVELGGVQPGDELVVLEPRSADLQAAFAEMDRRLASRAGIARRREVVVYFSGHSDETGLLLGGERFEYGDLKNAIRRLDADVRVAILDSCASGAIVRAKGGRVVPAFLVDASSDVAGHVFLTSSSADESSQEADRIASSFFTHALVTGLRGAADVNLDGQVTLNEAYRFAYDETLARTESTRRGAQHPAYDMALTGTGDFVLTDLHATSASLALDEALAGRLFIRDAEDRLVAELYKPAGRPVALGLPPGDYEVTLEHQGRLARARIDLAEGSTEPLASADFEALSGALHAARGNEDLRTVPVALQFVHGLGAEGDRPVRHASALGLVGTGAERLDGLAIASAYTLYPEGETGVVVSGAVNVSGPTRAGQVTGGANIVDGPFAGVQISGGLNVTGPARGIQATGGPTSWTARSAGSRCRAG
ncbi:MAG: caspase family protein [Deltaproteobacteria bacterium]|nr:caspase family protein [Deltaproteobacteria bacterium]